jgi:AcrR family transcriptional regulator
MTVRNPTAAARTRARDAVTSADRRARNRQRTRADILNAARAVMRESGVAALNLQEVARRVGMRAPSLYEYFPSKAALYDELFLLGTRLYARRIARLRWNPEIDAVWTSMAEIMRAYIGFAHQAPELFNLVFERHVPGFAPSQTSMDEAQTLLGGGYDKFRRAVERGSLVSDSSPEAMFDLFLSMMHGLAAQHLANEPQRQVGSGRFGSLIPQAIAVLRAAWSPTTRARSQ